MSGWFGGIGSVVNSIYVALIGVFSGYYAIVSMALLTLFLLFRGPYVFSPFFFIFFLWVAAGGVFSSLFLGRLFLGGFIFLSGFIPVGTPLWVCPLVALAETVSFVIRPFVLMLRPFINITLGCVGVAVVGGFGVSSGVWAFVLFTIFFYEVFVALVHWFIVTSILLFSIDH